MNAISLHDAEIACIGASDCGSDQALALPQQDTRSAGDAFGGCKPSQCGSRGWFVIRVVHQMRGLRRGEIIARDEVSAKGFRTYLPLKAEWKRARDNRSDVESIKPLFPGYLFAQFDSRDPGWGNIYTPAVKYVFCSATGRPVRVPDRIIDELMDKGRPGDGVIDERYTGPAFPRIETGAPVKITTGPFADIHGICKMSTATRVTLLMAVLGGDQPITLPRGSVLDLTPEKTVTPV